MAASAKRSLSTSKRQKSLQWRTTAIKSFAGTLTRASAVGSVREERPQFNRMLQDAREQKDFVAVICDDLDRFSRAEVMEVFADLSALAAAGIKTIHCVTKASTALEHVIAGIIKMVVDVHVGVTLRWRPSRSVALCRSPQAEASQACRCCS